MSATEEQVLFPAGLPRFDSVEAFYEADERRRYSGESDYGIFWWDGPQGYSDTWRISALATTGEIFAVLSQARRGQRTSQLDRVVLLGKVANDDPRFEVADRILEGWNLVCGESSSLRWAIARVLGATGECPAPLSILCRHQLLGAHIHAEIFVGRIEGSRGRAGELILRVEEWELLREGLERGFGDRVELVEAVASTSPGG